MDDIISARQAGGDLSNILWVFDALNNDPTKCNAIAPLITTRSFQYSADIVAVSGDGRTFKRVRIVVDSSTLPAKIVYRRDLTALGWPLPPEIRTSLQAGHGIPNGDSSGAGKSGQSHL